MQNKMTRTYLREIFFKIIYMGQCNKRTSPEVIEYNYELNCVIKDSIIVLIIKSRRLSFL